MLQRKKNDLNFSSKLYNIATYFNMIVLFPFPSILPLIWLITAHGCFKIDVSLTFQRKIYIPVVSRLAINYPFLRM
jgi:hypothetical protein